MAKLAATIEPTDECCPSVLTSPLNPLRPRTWPAASWPWPTRSGCGY